MASLGNMYPNLPGMLVEFKDGGQVLKFDQTEVDTDSMLILGTAIDGPIMEPVAVDDSTSELLFGSELKANGAPNGSTLMRAFKEAKANGCQDIRLMRITGKEASVTIKAQDEVVEEVNRIDENLGYVQGNEETEITLEGKGIIKDSVTVIAKGKPLSNKVVDVDVTLDVCKVTIAKDACDAGSIISVEYDYSKEVSTTDKDLELGTQREIYLNYDPIEGSVVVKKSLDSEVIDAGNYTITGRKIVFNEPVTLLNEVKKSVKSKAIATLEFTAEDTKFLVEYKYLEKGSDVETEDKLKVQFTAKTGEQKLNLTGKLKSKDELSLYIDGTLVLDKTSYNVDIESNTVSLKKEYFTRDCEISSSYFIAEKKVLKKEIKITSLFGGNVYNESKIEVMDYTNGLIPVKAVRLSKPISKLSTGEVPLIFTADNFETFGELVEAINTYSAIFKAETNVPNEPTSNLVYTESYFRGGDNGIDVSKEELFEALSGKRDSLGYLEKQGAYQILENYQVDWVVPVGVYADDKLLDRNKDFAYELALFCAINSTRNKSVYGAIPMKPLQDTSLASVQSHAKYLSSFKNQYFMKDNRGSVITDGSGNPIDLGKFISIIAGPTVTINHSVLSLRDANGAVAYVAYNTALLPQSAPTNKRMTGSTGVKYNFSNAQLNEIVGNRLVCFGKKFSARGQVLAGAYIVDGPTCARVGSEYGRLSTLKVLREVSDQIREVADPFIGEANSIEQRNALSAAISKRLDLLVTGGVVIDYSFNLVATQTDQVLGQASLELGIVAPQELRKITTVMGLKQGS